ncbi:MAG: dihydroorotate dehydrogenase electron transfer subunit [Bacteroidales bacterium]
MKKFVHDFEVVSNKRLNVRHFVLELRCSEKLPVILPGQFAEVRIDESVVTYLRRPFSIHDVDYNLNSLSFLVKQLGEGTAKLATIAVGEIINIVYPLGNGFAIPSTGKALLVGGGCGVAPLLMLAKHLSKQGLQITTLIGGRGSDDILQPEEYMKLGEVLITSEDGSIGEKGMVTDHSFFNTGIQSFSQVFTCGPEPMMKAIAAIAIKHGIPCQVSLENTMACGIGACLCCVVETKEGNKCVCTEGPVFDARFLTKWGATVC